MTSTTTEVKAEGRARFEDEAPPKDEWNISGIPASQIRAGRITTVGTLGTRFEKGIFEIVLSKESGVLITEEECKNFLARAGKIAEAMAQDFFDRYKFLLDQPLKPEQPKQERVVSVLKPEGSREYEIFVKNKGWKEWPSGKGGESLPEQDAPSFARILEEGKHYDRWKNPYRAGDRYLYWLYPQKAESGKERFIQRIRRAS